MVASEVAGQKVEFELDVAQQALAASGEACLMADEEASRLIDERVSLRVELGASKDELSTFCAEVTKKKKALEAEYNASFEVIFNYGYGCCAFEHNICGSKPGIPNGMPGTSQPLSPKFFLNPRCPPDVVPVEAVVAPKAGIRKEVEHSSATRAEIGDNLDSLSRVAREREEPGAFGES